MIDSYIRQILQEKKNIIVPDLGAITLNADQSFFFNPFLKFNDRILLKAIAVGEGISEDEALQEISTYIATLKEVVTGGGSFTIAEVGTFEINKDRLALSPLDKGSKLEEESAPANEAAVQEVEAGSMDKPADDTTSEGTAEEIPVPPTIEKPKKTEGTSLDSLLGNSEEPDASEAEVPPTPLFEPDTNAVVEVTHEEALEEPEKTAESSPLIHIEEVVEAEGETSVEKTEPGQTTNEEPEQEELLVSEDPVAIIEPEGETSSPKMHVAADIPLKADGSIPKDDLLVEPEAESQHTSPTELEEVTTIAQVEEEIAYAADPTPEKEVVTEPDKAPVTEEKKAVVAASARKGEKKRKPVLLLFIVLLLLGCAAVIFWQWENLTGVAGDEQLAETSATTKAPEEKENSSGVIVSETEDDKQNQLVVDTATKEDEAPEETKEVKEAVVPEAVTTTPSKDKIYHVVGGSFGSLENANNLVDILQGDGYDAHMIGKRGKLFIVAVSSHATRKEGAKALADFKAKGNEAWLLKKAL